jgi:hypothetical protein
MNRERRRTMGIEPILGGTHTLARVARVDLRPSCEVGFLAEAAPDRIPSPGTHPRLRSRLRRLGTTPVALRAPSVLPKRRRDNDQQNRKERKTGTYNPVAMGKFNCRRWGKVIDVGHC